MERLTHGVKKKIWAVWTLAKLVLEVITPLGFRQTIRVKSPDILFVGPAAMTIPAKGWGAVETVIHDQMEYLEQVGMRVSLLNSTYFLDWLFLFGSKPKVAYCHYDAWALPFLLLCKLYGIRSVSTTHYAYASQTPKWSKVFSRNISLLARHSVLFICLTDQIKETLQERFPGSNLVTIPNRMASVPTPRHTTGPVSTHRVLVLGKVEPRKSQVSLARILDEEFIENVDFVGPIVDSNFDNLPDSKKKAFLGEWTREEVWRRLKNYRFVMLASEAEADALVLHEAQLAGCEVITTPSAIGSQNSRLSHVHLIDRGTPDLGRKLRSIVDLPAVDPQRIRALAIGNSLWTEKAAIELAITILPVSKKT